MEAELTGFKKENKIKVIRMSERSVELLRSQKESNFVKMLVNPDEFIDVISKFKNFSTREKTVRVTLTLYNFLKDKEMGIMKYVESRLFGTFYEERSNDFEEFYETRKAKGETRSAFMRKVAKELDGRLNSRSMLMFDNRGRLYCARDDLYTYVMLTESCKNCTKTCPLAKRRLPLTYYKEVNILTPDASVYASGFQFNVEK